MLEKIKKNSYYPAMIQFLKFGTIGFFNTLLTYLIQNVGYYIFHLHEQISNIIAFIITVFISYLLNSKLVFKVDGEEKRHFWKALFKVYLSYSFTGIFLMAFLLYLQEDVFQIPHYIATMTPIVITVPINFLMNKFWAYGKKNK